MKVYADMDIYTKTRNHLETT